MASGYQRFELTSVHHLLLDWQKNYPPNRWHLLPKPQGTILQTTASLIIASCPSYRIARIEAFYINRNWTQFLSFRVYSVSVNHNSLLFNIHLHRNIIMLRILAFRPSSSASEQWIVSLIVIKLFAHQNILFRFLPSNSEILLNFGIYHRGLNQVVSVFFIFVYDEGYHIQIWSNLIGENVFFSLLFFGTV
jgi:hypothetical protein